MESFISSLPKPPGLGEKNDSEYDVLNHDSRESNKVVPESNLAVEVPSNSNMTADSQLISPTTSLIKTTGAVRSTSITTQPPTGNYNKNQRSPPPIHPSQQRRQTPRNSFGTTNSTSSNRPIPKIPQNSRPLPINTQSKSVPIKSMYQSPSNGGDHGISSLEDYILTNNQLAIPSRKRSISTHSGDDNRQLNFGDILNQVAEQQESRQRSYSSMSHKMFENSPHGIDNNGTRGKMRTHSRSKSDISQMLLVGKNIENEKKQIDGIKTDGKHGTMGQVQTPDTAESQPLGFAMERFLQSIKMHPQGLIDVEKGPEALKAVAPAGIIVNRADPMSANILQDNDSDDSMISSYDSGPIISIQENNNLKENENDIFNSLFPEDEYKNLDDESPSDGSIFEDTIGLEQIEKEALKMSLSISPPDSDMDTYHKCDKAEEDQRNKNRSNSISYPSEDGDVHALYQTSTNKDESDLQNIQNRFRPAMMQKLSTRSLSGEQDHPFVDGFEYDKYDYMPNHSPHENINKNSKRSRQSKKKSRRHRKNHSRGLSRTSESSNYFRQNDRPLQKYKGYSHDGSSHLISSYGDNYGSTYGETDIKGSSPRHLFYGGHNHNYDDGVYPQTSDIVPREVTLNQHFTFNDIEAKLINHQGGVQKLPYHSHAYKKKGHRRVNSIMESVFSSVRSESTEDIEADRLDSKRYTDGGVLERAFPERLFALLVTFTVEIPILVMLGGGRNKLCDHMGRSRFYLLLAFLPIIFSLSGNTVLQSNSLTTRAIKHRHIKKASFSHWLSTEVCTSVLLGGGIGLFMGILAYQASNGDFRFAFSITIAQLLSVAIAGFTGCLSPIASNLFFHQDSGKWVGLLETAVQDVITCAVVIIVVIATYVWSGEVADVNDRCSDLEI